MFQFPVTRISFIWRASEPSAGTTHILHRMSMDMLIIILWCVEADPASDVRDECFSAPETVNQLFQRNLPCCLQTSFVQYLSLLCQSLLPSILLSEITGKLTRADLNTSPDLEVARFRARPECRRT
jgi:hypothetical protein